VIICFILSRIFLSPALILDPVVFPGTVGVHGLELWGLMWQFLAYAQCLVSRRCLVRAGEVNLLRTGPALVGRGAASAGEMGRRLWQGRQTGAAFGFGPELFRSGQLKPSG
jgi:hypothetical protein